MTICGKPIRIVDKKKVVYAVNKILNIHILPFRLKINHVCKYVIKNSN